MSGPEVAPVSGADLEPCRADPGYPIPHRNSDPQRHRQRKRLQAAERFRRGR